MDALQLRAGGPTVHALLLLVAVGLAALAAWKLHRGAKVQAAVSAVTAVALLVWYLTTKTVPLEFVEMSPYVTTLLVLSLAAQRLRPPKAIGKSYRRGQGT